MKKIFLISLMLMIFAVGGSASMFDKVNDFDGDGRADYAVTRNQNGLKVWHIWRSTAGYLSVQWGVADDYVTPGDYDGDSRTDIAVSRVTRVGNQLVGTTYFLNLATGSFDTVQVEAISMFGGFYMSNEDFDGDGKTDPGIFQTHGISTFAYRNSSSGSTGNVSMGGDYILRTGDITGNNAAEVASYNSGPNRITARNVAQGGQFNIQFGIPGDQFVVADFDGDNTGEIAIFRQSSGDWWWLRSSDGVANAAHWGLNGDVPAPADYDGDGRSDLAIYRPGSPNGVYWVYGSQVGAFTFTWGIPGDSIVQY